MRKYFRGGCIAVVASALMVQGLAFAVADDGSSKSGGLTEAAADIAERVVSDAVDGLEDVYVDVYMDHQIRNIDDLVELVVEGVPTSVEGMLALEGLVADIEEESALVTDAESALTIDRVNVEAVGQIELVVADAETLSATVDIEITRHIAGDDVDWIEIVPHVFVLDAETAEIQGLVAQDLDFQLAHAPDSQVSPRRIVDSDG